MSASEGFAPGWSVVIDDGEAFVVSPMGSMVVAASEEVVAEMAGVSVERLRELALDDLPVNTAAIVGYARTNPQACTAVIDLEPRSRRSKARDLWECVIAPALLVAVGVAIMFAAFA